MISNQLTIKQKLEYIKMIKDRSEIPIILKVIGLNKRICELGVRWGKNLRHLAIFSNADLLVGIDAWDQKVDHLWKQEQHDKCYESVQKLVKDIKNRKDESVDTLI